MVNKPIIPSCEPAKANYAFARISQASHLEGDPYCFPRGLNSEGSHPPIVVLWNLSQGPELILPGNNQWR